MVRVVILHRSYFSTNKNQSLIKDILYVHDDHVLDLQNSSSCINWYLVFKGLQKVVSEMFFPYESFLRNELWTTF